jgi:O-antigen ligase
MIRVYGYISAWNAFRENWLFGVGFLAVRYISERYNDLRVGMLGPENFFLETAVGMGVIGLAVVLRWYASLIQLGREVRRVTPPGTLGHEIARVHVPLMVGLAAVNMVGDQWIGMVGIGQVALWCALMVRSGHLAVASARPT